MRVEFCVQGGLAYFPGLSKPITIDTDQLPAEEAAALRRLVDEAHVFDPTPTAATPARGAADPQQYTITIEDAGRTRTIQLTDPVPPEFRPLLDALRARLRVSLAQARGHAAEQHHDTPD